jgi:hypothetical protein
MQAVHCGPRQCAHGWPDKGRLTYNHSFINTFRASGRTESINTPTAGDVRRSDVEQTFVRLITVKATLYQRQNHHGRNTEAGSQIHAGTVRNYAFRLYTVGHEF